MKTLRNLLQVVTVALVVAAVYKEMQKPREEREWHGTIANFIPYDFRPPTVERLRERFWNPEDPRILTEHAFGVGWSVNFYTLLNKLQVLQKEPGTPTPEDAGE